jgi:hypothetical protein
MMNSICVLILWCACLGFQGDVSAFTFKDVALQVDGVFVMRYFDGNEVREIQLEEKAVKFVPVMQMLAEYYEISRAVNSPLEADEGGELRLSDEQKQKIQSVYEAVSSAFVEVVVAESTGKFMPRQVEQRLNELRESAKPVIGEEFLDTKQQSRLKQLQFQGAIRSAGLGRALTLPQIAKELELTEEQMNRIRKIVADSDQGEESTKLREDLENLMIKYRKAYYERLPDNVKARIKPYLGEDVEGAIIIRRPDLEGETTILNTILQYLGTRRYKR